MRTVVSFLLVASPLYAQEIGAGVRLREWFARYDGTLTADGRPNNGTRLDAASDLGMGDFEFAHEIQVSLDVPRIERPSAAAARPK